MTTRFKIAIVRIMTALFLLSSGFVPASAAPAAAPPAAPSSCGVGDPLADPPVGTCTVTIDARDFPTDSPLDNFNYIINVDNTKLPSDYPLALSTESNSPIVRTGDQDRPAVTLPDGRYLVSVRSLDHKMWGAYFTLPDDAANDGTLTLTISLTTQTADNPLPLGKIRVFVFNDNAWTNGAPDTEEGGLGGFQVELDEQTDSAVTVDYFNNPLCGGVCKTSSAAATLGFVEIPNLGPATYFIHVRPPETQCNSNPDSRWYQTTTIDGGLSLMAPTEEGADGTGAPGEQLWEPPIIRTAYWFGFVCAPQDFAASGTGEIVGQARNWVEWAPYTFGTVNDPVDNPFVALTDTTSDLTVFVGRGDEFGNFDIQNVPAGSYDLSIWDEQLSYIMRFKPITVGAGETVDANETYDDGSLGVGVSRWFGWLDGTVYKDVNGNGQYDDGVDDPMANTDVDQRWRDGSIKEGTFTDPNGYYVYPTAEGGALGRWIVGEQGFARFSAFPGASVHDEHTGAVLPSCVADIPADPCLPNSQGGGLLVNSLLLEGHRMTVDWGKVDYPDGTPGQIVGITYFATTRNEFKADLQAHEDYEPAVPDAVVYLETLGPDLTPNTDDDVVVNKYVTDHWQHPNVNQDPVDPSNPSFSQSCNPIMDFAGNPITGQFSPDIGPNCLEVPLAGQQTKEGAFDGGYAFADYCPGGYDLDADDGTCVGGGDPVSLVAGDYMVHAIMPKDPTDTRPCNDESAQKISNAIGSVPGGGFGCLYRIVREEDVNVDLGNQFGPAIPPPPCVGDDHVLDQASLVDRSPYFGDATAHAPLCDKKLVVLQNLQNANADFNMMTNFRTDPNGTDANDTRTGDVAEPGRVIGQVFNDIYFERNQESHWFGEPRPIGSLPIGIYARVDTVPNVSCPEPNNPNRCFTPDKWRLIKTLTTSLDGSYEILLPSTETLNCPIPQGPCPGMYIAIVNDPGSTAHPNAGYNPNLLTANTPFEVWPGLTTQLDTPVDPISGTACEDPLNPDQLADEPLPAIRPDLLQVSRPYVLASDSGTARRITIQADFIGTTGPALGAGGVRATLTDARNGQVQTLTRANGGIVSWTPGNLSVPDTIVIQIPALDATFRPGPKQLTLTRANINGGGSSVNGITLHVLGSNTIGTSTVTYNPPIVPVAPPPPTGSGSIQSAINSAAPGSLIVLSEGIYNENLLLWKPLKLQGLGPGGIIGARESNNRNPEDPRFSVQGSVIDGRFFPQNATAFDTLAAVHPGVLPNFTNGNPSVVLRGADITVNAASTTAYDPPSPLPSTLNQTSFNYARIDGLGLTTGRGDGAGGIQLQASINNMQLTNNILENNGGIFAGGIGLGQLYVHGSHNYNVRIANDRFIGNGGLTTSGGVGIFYGSNNYEVANSLLCSNFSVEYGAGISHIGLSPGGNIHDNNIYYNDAVDSGAGIAIEGELVVGGGTLSDGSGPVNVDRNLIHTNYSGDDGGGIFILDALTAEINIRNNIIADNGASDIGGGVTLDDASNVRFVNNTVANNVSTGASENSAVGVPRSAGLASEANDPLFQATLPISAPHFSNPVALFNNIFWENNAMTLTQFGPGATLVDNGFIDFEIHDPTNGAQIYSNARYNLFTNGNVEQADGTFANMPGGGAPVVGFPTNPAFNGNIVGVDPLFVFPFSPELAVTGSRLDPQAAAVTIVGADPPEGLLLGDYHLQPALAANLVSGAVDRGVRCSNAPVPPSTTPLAACTGGGISAPIGTNADIDGQSRPGIRTLRLRTPWDFGADELPTGIGTSSGSAVPATPVLDAFNRNTPVLAGGVPLSGNWAGSAQQPNALTGYLAYSISSNQALIRNTNGLGPVIWYHAGGTDDTFFGANQEAYFKFTDVSASASQQALLLKGSGFNSGFTQGPKTSMIIVSYNKPNNKVLVRTFCGSQVAGCNGQGWVTRATITGVTFVNGDVFSAQALSNGTVHVFKNGTEIGTANLLGGTPWPSAAGSGRIGVWFKGTGDAATSDARFDDFGGGTLP